MPMTLGIDIGKRRHNVTLLDEQGKKIFHNIFIPNDRSGVEQLMDLLSQTHLSPKGIMVGMEATGHYWLNFYAHLVEQGFATVDVINPIVIHARKNDHIRGAKTDRIDAFQIAKYMYELDRCTSALPVDQQAEIRELSRHRYDLNQAAIAEKVRLISKLDVVFPEYKGQFNNLFARSSLMILAEYPSAESVAKVDIRTLTSLLKKTSRGRLGRKKAEQLKKAARQSFATTKVHLLSLEIRWLVERLNLLLDQIDELNHLLVPLFAEEQKLLQTITGIGPVLAPLILGEVLPVFSPKEKNGARKLVAYAGLDATPNLSGKNYDSLHSNRSTRMSKRGSKYLRTAMYQAASIASHTTSDPVFSEIYNRQIAKGKAHKVAISHVARKMIHVVFAVLRDNKSYVPILPEEHLAKQQEKKQKK